ncbi:MAG TPA: hypothetical protein VMC04_16190 [Verrucomicrobiae bacterium]|jgi:hypothetical protein|nr:hypothetical protein [Verrucomicrobiae bacterium]
MIYAKAFFDLQLQFAHKVAALSGMPLDRALLEYTNLYVRFGLGRDFDPARPAWREYVAGLQTADDAGEWTYRFYLTRPAAAPPGIVATCGCFSYARLGDDRIRLHFLNVETDGHSPLGRDRAGQRRADLSALFEGVKRAQCSPLRVLGVSWLYNLEAYRRLFPPSYAASARVAEPPRFRNMPLWGQFLDRHGQVRTSPARQFLERLERQPGLDGLGRCFPLPVLSAEAPVEAFYAFYGIR